MTMGTLVVPVWDRENWKKIREFISKHGLNIRMSKSFNKKANCEDLSDFIESHGAEILGKASEFGAREGMHLGVAYPFGDTHFYSVDVHYYRLRD